MSDGNKMIRDQMCELADNQTLRRERQEMSAEIERLRKENQTIVDKAFEQAEMDRKRIEGLKSKIAEFIHGENEGPKGIFIPRAKIRSAWEFNEDSSPETKAHGRAMLYSCFGIDQCEGCGGSGLRPRQKSCKCLDCNGDGFTHPPSKSQGLPSPVGAGALEEDDV